MLLQSLSVVDFVSPRETLLDFVSIGLPHHHPIGHVTLGLKILGSVFFVTRSISDATEHLPSLHATLIYQKDMVPPLTGNPTLIRVSVFYSSPLDCMGLVSATRMMMVM